MIRHKDILKLAIPNIISNMVVPLNGIIDIAILGHYGNISQIGALALASLIFNFLY
ncbi:MAG: hypothetical protein IPO21_05810 [Bacteroidales bacterium]|nr:hypothetical protein [Bacteroidales bacterium]